MTVWVLVTLAFSSATAMAQQIYWVDSATGIHRSDLDGLNREQFIPVDFGGVTGIALDTGSGKVYWADVGTHKIRRANLDGSQVEDLIHTGAGRPNDITLDLRAQRIYWTERYGSIHRANMDGSEMEVVTDRGGSGGIALDLDAGKMYWTSSSLDIFRANLDGSNWERAVETHPVSPQDIAIHVADGKIYWVGDARQAGFVQRANLDGSEVETLLLLGFDSGPRGIALDTSAGEIYWTTLGRDRAIWRANLDGAEAEIITENTASAIAVDAENGTIYWTGVDKIQRT